MQDRKLFHIISPRIAAKQNNPFNCERSINIERMLYLLPVERVLVFTLP